MVGVLSIGCRVDSFSCSAAQERRRQIDGDVPRDLHQSPDPHERMQAGVDLAVQLITGCDHAGITLVQGHEISAGAATDDVVARADAVQHELREGPCVDVATLENRTIYVADLSRDRRWPQWASRITQDVGVRSLLSLQLYTRDRSFGALNLYSDHPDAFDPHDFDLAENVAAHLAVAITDAQEIEHRGKGMVSRTIIGQAEGILMERYGIGSSAAFAYLRRASQDTNRKLSQVAQELVRTRELPVAAPPRG